MHKVFSDRLVGFCSTGNIEKDSLDLLNLHKCEEVAQHSKDVAYEAQRIAEKFGIDVNKAFIAGCLHDISRIFSDDQKIHICKELGIEMLPGELAVPSLLHPKVSRAMAVEIFDIRDVEILNAIECHSTLKANAGSMEMILFIADKITWDETYSNAFMEELKKGLENSLEQAAFAYLKYMYDNRHSMKFYHPWALEAYKDVDSKII